MDSFISAIRRNIFRIHRTSAQAPPRVLFHMILLRYQVVFGVFGVPSCLSTLLEHLPKLNPNKADFVSRTG